MEYTNRAKMTVPLFKSHFSVGKSILTLEKPSEISDADPISVFSIAKAHDLKEVCLVEDSMSGFLQAFTNAKSQGIKLVFGYRVTITDDMNERSDASLKKNSKIIIFPKNKEGYEKLIKISTNAACDGFYYEPRIDYKFLKENYSDDIKIAIPFYDSFLFNNALYGHLCVPDFSFFNPTFFVEDNSLPFDYIISNLVKSYASDKYNIVKTQSVFYYKKEDFLAYLTFKCINNRSTLSKPNFNHMGSDSFCFESVLKDI